MKVRVFRRGGSDGYDDELATTDSRQLSPLARSDLDSCLRELRAQPHQPAGADGLHFEIEVEGDPGSPYCIGDEGESHDPAGQLVHHLLRVMSGAN